MTPGQFARKRDRIMHNSPGRSDEWRKRAMKRLAADAGAVPQHAGGGRVIAWRMSNGQLVCVKHRYASEQQANNAMTQMQREPDGRRKPIRAYPCYACFGWHITSQQK
jgi:hypothetical protein